MTTQQPSSGWRLWVGTVLFALSISWPILIPILPLLGVSAKTTAAFGGVMVIGAELMMIAGAAIAGKEGFAVIKASLFGFLRSYGPPGEVSRNRYRIGLVLFTLPLAFGLFSPYLGHHLPGFENNQWIYAVVGDVLLLISLFVLGGNFWGKLQALFYHDAYTVIPSKTTTIDLAA